VTVGSWHDKLNAVTINMMNHSYLFWNSSYLQRLQLKAVGEINCSKIHKKNTDMNNSPPTVDHQNFLSNNDNLAQQLAREEKEEFDDEFEYNNLDEQITNNATASPPTLASPQHANQAKITTASPAHLPAPTAATDAAIESLTEDEQKILIQQLVRQTPEYKVAWELELWKHTEKKKFLLYLKKREQEHLQQLTRQHQAKCADQEDAIKKQQVKLEDLDTKLQQKHEEVEAKKGKIIDAERELKRRKQELEFDYERKLADCNHQIQIAREQCAHKISLYENEILSWKQKDDNNALVILELKQKLEKTTQQCQEELEMCTKQKKNYKYQYKQAQDLLKQLQNEKQTLYNELITIRQQQLAVNQQPVRHHAKPKHIKQQVPISIPVSAVQQVVSTIAESPAPSPTFESPTDKNEYMRLQSKKNELLKTGGYDAASPLIRQIDVAMQQLVTRQKGNH